MKRSPKPRKEREPSALERAFMTRLTQLAPDLLGYEREFCFARPRKFRADFCFVQQRVIVELEGGVHSGGRHVRGTGYEADCEKYNLAAVRGYKVLRFTARMLRDDPQSCIDQIRTLVKGVGE